MSPRWNRREVLKGLLAASTAIMVPTREAAQDVAPSPAGQIEIQITPISSFTFRLSILPVENGSVTKITTDGSLVRDSWIAPVMKLRAGSAEAISVGNFGLRFQFIPSASELRMSVAMLSSSLIGTKRRVFWHS